MYRKDEAVKHLIDGGTLILECDGDSYEISHAENWCGGEGMEGFISEALGNVAYSDANFILEETIQFLQENYDDEVLINF